MEEKIIIKTLNPSILHSKKIWSCCIILPLLANVLIFSAQSISMDDSQQINGPTTTESDQSYGEKIHEILQRELSGKLPYKNCGNCNDTNSFPDAVNSYGFFLHTLILNKMEKILWIKKVFSNQKEELSSEVGLFDKIPHVWTKCALFYCQSALAFLPPPKEGMTEAKIQILRIEQEGFAVKNFFLTQNDIEKLEKLPNDIEMFKKLLPSGIGLPSGIRESLNCCTAMNLLQGSNVGLAQLKGIVLHSKRTISMIFEEAKGKSITDILNEENTQDCENALKSVAKWLYELHKLGFSKLESLLFVHGDAHTGNFFYEKETQTITAIDYETLARTEKLRGDPAKDIGRFIGSLWKTAAELPLLADNNLDSYYDRFSKFQNVFLTEYLNFFYSDNDKIFVDNKDKFIESIKLYKENFFKMIINSNLDKDRIGRKKEHLSLFCKKMLITLI